MFRLTTPTHRFILALDPREWVKFTITYAQDRKIVLEKTEQDDFIVEEFITTNCHGDDVMAYILLLTLSQEDTQKFKANARKTEIQIRCLYSTGDSFASQIIPIDVRDVLNDQILSYETSPGSSSEETQTK